MQCRISRSSAPIGVSEVLRTLHPNCEFSGSSTSAVCERAEGWIRVGLYAVLLGTGAFNRAFIMPSNDNGVLVAAPSNLTVTTCNRDMVLLYHPTSPLEIFVDIQSDHLAFSWAVRSYSRHSSYPSITLHRLYNTLCRTALH